MRVNRRLFLQLAGNAALLASAGALGCAVNPVTGERQFMLVSEDEERAIDKQYVPHQLSTDYGQTQDAPLNDYVAGVGRDLAARSHRPGVPYSFRVVNAPYVNAYAFPGGSIAATRGILLQLDDEAQLAALLGHELGHVNARHTAARMSSSSLLGLLLGGAAVAAGAMGGEAAGEIAGAVGSLGGGLLLASYSRDDERQADGLGMEYLTRGGYGTQGMVGLMEMLDSQHKARSSSLAVMFSTHPMSTERLETARAEAAGRYAAFQDAPLHRERYMDATAGLRRMAGAIEAQQQGDEALGKGDLATARERYAASLAAAPQDYCGHVKLAQAHLARKEHREARRLARAAQDIYPQEARARMVAGRASLALRDYDAAYEDFEQYDRLLAGNPDVTFLKGYCLENMGRQELAAAAYVSYLKRVNQGDKAQYAAGRLARWGYLR